MRESNCRILYITYNGSEAPIFQSQVLPQICSLSQIGYKISLLSFEKRNSLKQNYKIRKKVENILNKHNIKWYQSSYHRNPPFPSTIYDIIVGAIYGAWLIKINRIDVIHARQVVCGCMGYIIKKLLNVKYLYDMRGKFAEEKVSHGWRYNGSKYKLVKSIDNLIIKNSDGIVVLTSNHLGEIKTSHLLKKNKPILEKIPCCVDLNKFQYSLNERVALRRQLHLNNKFVLIYIGSLGTCYFFNEMLDFFLAAKKFFKNRAFFLLLINNISSEIYKIIEEKGIHKSDFKLSHVESEEIPAFLSASDAGICFINSYMKSASFPIKFAEFLACGLPIILNNGIGDTDQFVTKNKIGIVIENFAEEQYQRAINKLAEILKKKDTISSTCRKIARDHLSLEKAVGKYNKIYQSILKKES